MDRSGAKSRAGTRKRQPLGDGYARANIVATAARPRKAPKYSSSASSVILPHHESLDVNGGLTVQNAASPNHKRTLAITSEDDDKRNSQVSNASTTASAAKKKSYIGPWQLGPSIGDGSVGKVRKVRHSVTGQEAAAKIIDKRTADASRAESMAHLVRPKGSLKGEGVVLPFGIEREVAIMKLLDHDNIVRLYDVWENRSQLYLIMEYVDGGELFDHIQNQRLQEDEIFWIFRKVTAALLHAHRLGIYHRDLKPENILLSWPTEVEPGYIPAPEVKLADFGMAALQPKGKTLKSPCGSIHYAAPEIFFKDYDGAKADVWSLGVILYVMFTGSIPFTSGDATSTEEYYQLWFEAMHGGLQEIPSDVASVQACDLLRVMLVPDPKKRISLNQVWAHPWFVVMSEAWGESKQERSVSNWIGPTPTIDQRPKSLREIDRETLRNLSVLWHSEKEDNLVKKLLSRDDNLEKIFYSAIIRHRDEALEDFAGNADELYSASDHHHLKPVLHPSEVPPLPPTAFTRTKSNFSILNDDIKRSRNSLANKSAPSERSYDPFRVSRSNVGSVKDSYRVTVRRGQSTTGGNRNTAPDVKPAKSLRVDALKREQQRHSMTSSLTNVTKTSPSPARTSRRTMSRNSLASSSHVNSPTGSILYKPSNAHKRGVNFSRSRRSSTVSALSIHVSNQGISKTLHPTGETLDQSKLEPKLNHRTSSQLKDAISHPELILADPRLTRVRRSPSQSRLVEYDIRNDIRKVSNELETICDQSFNRISADSSNAPSTATYGPSTYETPPSSISNRASTHSNLGLQALPQDFRSQAYRSLSETPGDTPNTYMHKQLAETKKKFSEKYAWDPNAREIMAQIDALLQTNSRKSHTVDGQRVTSAPSELRLEEHSGHLPIISEEDKFSDDAQSLRHSAGTSQRGLSELHKRRTDARAQSTEPHSTVRLINPSSPRRPAPLNVRKVSNTSSRSTRQSQLDLPVVPPPRFYGDYPSPPPRSPKRRHNQSAANGLSEIAEDIPRDTDSQKVGESFPPPRRWNWFNRKPVPERNVTPSLPRAQSLNNKASLSAAEHASKAVHHTYAPYGRNESPPASPTVVVPGKRPGFLSFLARYKKPKRSPGRIVSGGDDDSASSVRSNGVQSTVTSYTKNAIDHRSLYKHQQAGGSRITTTEEAGSIDIRNLGVQRNWIARFLNIKPAMQVMCFNTSRGRARVELVRLLRSWKAYGICDVVSDKERHLVFGRLAADNYLRLKEVAFVVQLFVVLERDERANLAIARFTQRKGAASSFRIVTAKVEDVLASKGLMVNDAQKRRDMEDVLHG